MSRILFENKKAALGFAGAIIVGAMIFSGVSTTTASDAGESRLARGEVTAPAKNKADNEESENAEKEEIAFADDEELIDDTGGFDTDPEAEKSDERPEQPADSGSDRSSGGDDSDGGSRYFDRDGYPRLDDDEDY